MNRTLSESSDGGHGTRSGSGSGRTGSQKRQPQQPRLNRSMSSGYTTGNAAAAVRVGVGSPPIYAERDPRLRTVAEPDSEFGENFGNFRDLSESPPPSSTSSLSSKRSSRGQKARNDSMFRERSIDSGSGSAEGDLSATGTAQQTASGASPSSNPANAFKSIWMKTVDRLIKKMKVDSPAPAPDAATASAASATGSTAEAAQQVAEPGGGSGGEVDPVYSFLKLTSVMPRQGTTNVIPGQGHRCCPGSKSNGQMNDVDIDDTTYTHSNDPSRCQCPCHLPERLDAYRYEWQRAFVIKKNM